MRFRIVTRGAVVRIAVVAGLSALVLVGAWAEMIRMPGESHAGALAPLDEGTKILAATMDVDLTHLAGALGERNVDRAPLALAQAADWIEASLVSSGYAPQRQTFEVRQVPCSNLEVELTGAHEPSAIVLVGAHYDTAFGTPGADDNGSGVVALLALARHYAGTHRPKTLRFVFFVNEEPPFFWGPDMGSVRYARRSRARNEDLRAMLALETLGHFDDAPASQRYPFPMSALYPDRGNFVAFVGNTDSRELVRRSVATFRQTTPFPSEGAALPDKTTGVGWSDHEPFWNQGYPALMVTDTALFRGTHYHKQGDVRAVVDVERLARVTVGLEHVLDALTE